MSRGPIEPQPVASLLLVVLLKRTRTGWQVGVGTASTGITHADVRDYRDAGTARTAAMALAAKRGLLVLRSDD